MKNFFRTRKARLRDKTGRNVVSEKINIPDGYYKKCNNCDATLHQDDIIKNSYVCPSCNQYFRIRAVDRIKMVADEFLEFDEKFDINNPLNFPNYTKKIAELKARTGNDEAVLSGLAKINGSEFVLGVMDSYFLMGSMGSVVGEKITRLFEYATKSRLPVVLFTCSGGARMQEGIVSLMQMAKTSAAVKRHSDKGLLYVTVLTDPTTGGVTASFASLGDIILAEPGALIGFAGPRVIKQTIKQDLPTGFQRAEFLQEKGFVDKIIERKDMKKAINSLLKLHSRGANYVQDSRDN